MKVNWRNLYSKKINPPFRPNINLSNFDPEYTELPIQPEDYLPDPVYSETNSMFNEFYCDNTSNLHN
jgi:hypothetical protein